MADSHSKEKKTLSIDELISRAKITETAEKFQISNNYYFILLSRHSDTLMKDQNLYTTIVNKFIHGIILLPVCSQKERLINYAIENDSLNIFEHKALLEKFLKYEIVYMDDIKGLMNNCPKEYAKFDYERSIFQHNLFSLSRVFEAIKFDSLEKFLNMKIDKILNYTVKLNIEGTIKANINESKKLITFIKEEDTSTRFDKQIQHFCLKAKMLAEYIKEHSSK